MTEPSSRPNHGPYVIVGARIDELEPSKLIERIMAKAREGRPAYCCVTNVHQCMLVRDDPTFAAVADGADLIVTDSRILHYFLMRRYKLPKLPTLRGAELMMELCQQSAAEGLPVGLIGGRDDSVLRTLSEKLLSSCPGLDIAYSFSPPFRTMTAEETEAMTEGLRASGAKLIFVGLGCPKQERWMAEHSRKLDAMLIGVGAAFDFNSGAVRKSPAWIHAAGLEWAYRLLSEPRRLWRRYLTTGPKFLFAILTGAEGRRA
jgi:N-acetylglucosaminyldiphosphoundecaprenol N-acetyl-beta-D-mannosaminyltransferase